MLPSTTRSEAFGLVLLEAAKYSKPVITTQLNTGTSFIVKNNYNGFIIEPNNAKQLKDKINILLNDKAKCKIMGSNNYTRLKKNFCSKKMLKNYNLIMSKSISVILPAYNESLSIKKTLLEFHNLYPDLNIFVIDNNSDDDTQKISKETYLEYKISGKIIYEPKKGKANAIRTAFREIDADIYVMCDSDHTYFAEDLKKLIDYYKKNKYDIIIGDRISSGAYANQNKRFLHLLEIDFFQV